MRVTIYAWAMPANPACSGSLAPCGRTFRRANSSETACRHLCRVKKDPGAGWFITTNKPLAFPTHAQLGRGRRVARGHVRIWSPGLCTVRDLRCQGGAHTGRAF
jgi:hypothetical protein